MSLRRNLALVLASLSLVAFSAGTTRASATAQPVEPFVGTGAVTAQWTITGKVLGPYGKARDNVIVEAFVGDGTPPVASALTYGGKYSLSVDPGTYRITFIDATGETAPAASKTVTVRSASVALGPVQLLYPAPSVVSAPKIRGEAALGKTVQAVPGKWTGEDLLFSYTWLVNDHAVGTGDAYRISGKDLGKTLALRVSAASERTLTGQATTAAARVARASSAVATEKAKVFGRTVTVPVRVTSPANLSGGRVEVREVGKSRVLGAAATSGLRAWNGKIVLKGVPSGTHAYVVSFTGTKSATASETRVKGVRVR